MISRVIGSFTEVRRGCFSPLSGADSITNDTSPLAIPCETSFKSHRHAPHQNTFSTAASWLLRSAL